ncbi:tryptophan halogenase family protein [Hephaestia mangrovi]|uniref:tryptophan halogenase family protein n=1 Tax=Hephaestia mangrovi TaxID=2873268 RepID=UPI001CA640D7|nr:tryptophan halogenase family protein [Hephaestia mangrovi]MBY8828337.1 tryptophan 7-halogenase [Hephaestia mangrovi]
MTETNPRKRVVVAGGGTAGWLAATALVRQLGPLVDVTLVESDEIGTVGVGESTIPTIRTFHSFAGIEEDAFVRATGATFKLGISFENWRRDGDHYFHSFGSVGRSVFLADFQHFWLEARAQGFGGSFGDYSFELRAARENRFTNDPEAGLAYAYHLDATAYARFLRGLAEPAGVRRVEGRIAAVERDGEGGDITALTLASGARIEGDFFIDCTGFRALLIEGALETGFEDWSHWLPTDSALAVQTELVGPPAPYTRAIAHRAGWRWRIPLQHRMGNGFVFSSAQMSEDEARAQFAADLEGAPLFEPRLLRYTTGMRRQAWHRNCLALGLAAGFVEPLESTSIHLVMIAITRFIRGFPFARECAALADRFNAQSRAEWEHVRDFVILHYYLNQRDGTFWPGRAAMNIPDTLAARIALFRQSAAAYQDQDDLFRIDSWAQVLFGQGVEPASWHRIARTLPPEQLRRALADLDAGLAARVARLPTQAAFLGARYAPSPAAAAG